MDQRRRVFWRRSPSLSGTILGVLATVTYGLPVAAASRMEPTVGPVPSVSKFSALDPCLKWQGKAALSPPADQAAASSPELAAQAFAAAWPTVEVSSSWMEQPGEVVTPPGGQNPSLKTWEAGVMAKAAIASSA